MIYLCYLIVAFGTLVAPIFSGAAGRHSDPRPRSSVHVLTRLQSDPDSVTVVPGARYAKGRFVRWISGDGYRDLWTIPIRVPVADLSQMAGGLTPVRMGGGMTTKTLHVNGATGRRYVFRSVDKDAGQGLGEDLRGTPYEAVLQDQISSFHPSAALVLPPLLDAVGVLHTNPQFFVLPDDESLGEFRELMAGRLVLFEERPDEEADDTPGFAGSRKIVSTPTFFERLRENPKHRLDAHTFLAARFVDLLVGDRDRSVNNWLWARFDDGDGYLWEPIPRDRDQAFVELDGLGTGILRIYEPRMVRFSSELPEVVGLSRNAWSMDRAFLVGIDKAAWDSVLAFVRSSLSDSVIDAAVRRMPPEHVRHYGETLARQLKTRRDRLGEASDRLYRIVAEFADIYLTDEPEDVLIERHPDGRTTVTVYAATDAVAEEDDSSGDSHASPGTTLFHRSFVPSETREIRLYAFDGRDRVTIHGIPSDDIMLRIVGGSGADTVENTSGGPVHVYDAGDGTTVSGRETRWSRRDAPRPVPWGEVGPKNPDWGLRWLPRLAAPYSSDLGVLLYLGASKDVYGFLNDPYRTRLTFGAGYVLAKNKFVADFKYSVRNLWRGLHGSAKVEYTGIEILNYHGAGNDTPNTEDSRFYEVGREALHVSPVATFDLSRSIDLDLDLRFDVSSTDTLPDEPNFVSETRPYGSGTFLQAGAGAAVRFDTRDRPNTPTRGVLFTGHGEVYPELFDVNNGMFGGVGAEMSAYASASETGNQTVAVRVGGEALFGEFPYYESAFLGGSDRLRGFRDERFAGDASLYGSAELRLFLGRVEAAVPWDVGVFGFADTGRIYLDGESPGGWHSSAGGGIWLAPLYREFTASLTVARSGEGTSLYLTAGFGI